MANEHGKTIYRGVRKSKFEEKVISLAGVITDMKDKLNYIESILNRTFPVVGGFIDTFHEIELTSYCVTIVMKELGSIKQIINRNAELQITENGRRYYAEQQQKSSLMQK